MLEKIVVGCWIAALVIVAIAGVYVHYGQNDLEIKRKWTTRSMIFLGFWLVLGATSITFVQSGSVWPSLAMFFITIPITFTFCYLAYNSLRLCTKCGSIVASSNPFVIARFCTKCGAKLESLHKGHDKNIE